MNFSYWEYKNWFSDIDFTVVGSGIVGLSCALHLKTKLPKAKVIVLEKGMLPQGASTKNAGFACFGSISEILKDLEGHTEEEVFELVQKRWKGIQLLRETLGDNSIDFQKLGGHEVFLENQGSLYEQCLENLDTINRFLKPIYGNVPYEINPNLYGFSGVKENYITNSFEGQIDTGKMMAGLLQKAQAMGIKVLNSIFIESFEETPQNVIVKTSEFEFTTRKLCIATNGFASQLLEQNVKPARAQVLITKPIPNLKVKGSFHMNEGFYYFRNIDNRILLGGGRNLDFETETTANFGLTRLVQTNLESTLKEVILPGMSFTVDRRWSGIMGIGNQKRPIVKPISNKVSCGIRLGGMGIAIGSLIGKELASISA